MFVPVLGMKNVSHVQTVDDDLTAFLGVHIDHPAENNENLWAVIHMPLVGLVCPMQTHGGCPFDTLDRQRTPSAIAGKLGRCDFTHGFLLVLAPFFIMASHHRLPCQVTELTCHPLELLWKSTSPTNAYLPCWRKTPASARPRSRERSISHAPPYKSVLTTMEANGIIECYRTEIAPSAGMIRAVIFVQIANRPCGPALEWLQSLEGVTSVQSLSGDIDALVHVLVPNLSALSAFNDTLAASPLISSAKSSAVLRTLVRARLAAARVLVNAARGDLCLCLSDIRLAYVGNTLSPPPGAAVNPASSRTCSSDALNPDRDRLAQNHPGGGQARERVVDRVARRLVGDDQHRRVAVGMAILAHPVDRDAFIAQHGCNLGQRAGLVGQRHAQVVGRRCRRLGGDRFGEGRSGLAKGRQPGATGNVDHVRQNRRGGRAFARARTTQHDLADGIAFQNHHVGAALQLAKRAVGRDKTGGHALFQPASGHLGNA